MNKNKQMEKEKIGGLYLDLEQNFEVTTVPGILSI